MLRCFSVHRCKSVWCMDILRDDDNNKPLIIISGWSDGGVRRYHLDDVPIDYHEKISLNNILENDVPRNIIFFDYLTLIVHMNSGQLLKIEQDNNISLFYDGRNILKNGYTKMSMANDENEYLAVGSLNGLVFIFNRDGKIINEFQININKNNKILQILWLTSSKLLVCIPDGMMVNKSRGFSFFSAIVLSSTSLEYVLFLFPLFLTILIMNIKLFFLFSLYII